MRAMILVFAVGAACGGAQTEQAAAPAAPAASGAAADPAAYAALSDFFAKKRPYVSQCYGNAITNRELKEDAKGRIRLALRVLPSGQAQDVRVVETTLSSKPVEDCVVKLVQSWTLPAPDRPLDFLYTYEFSNL
jgi:hypothetical protein